MYDDKEQSKTDDVDQTLQTRPTVVSRKVAVSIFWMMEMQPRHPRTQNVYDVPEEKTKTEDLYQSLETTPAVAAGKALNGKKIMVLLLIVNSLLLIPILLVTGIHYFHFRQCGEELLKDQKTNQEMWYLHGEMFYLFWSSKSDCQTAKMFCAERMANLATVTNSNTDWLDSHINGKRMLVTVSQPHSSGNNDRMVDRSQLPSPEGDFQWEDYDDSLFLPGEYHSDGDDGDDESDCELFSVNSDLSEQVEGWVCEKAAEKKTPY